jgi:hypothetical protein
MYVNYLTLSDIFLLNFKAYVQVKQGYIVRIF